MKTILALLALASLGTATAASASQPTDPHMAGMEHAAQPAKRGTLSRRTLAQRLKTTVASIEPVMSPAMSLINPPFGQGCAPLPFLRGSKQRQAHPVRCRERLTVVGG